MTVPSTARRAGPFLGNGSATTFSFAFKTFAAGNLQVVKTSTIGVESVLVLASDYTVSLNPDQDASPGGTITYPVSGAPLATGEKLTVLSLLAYEQTTDLLGGGAFNARVIEDTFDRTVIQIQQLEERLDRALSLPASSTANPVTGDPQALHLLAWNSAGNGLQNVNPADLLQVAGSFGFNTQTFSGTGTQTAFTLSASPGVIANLEVFIAGVRQMPTTDYTVSGTTLMFTSAPPAGSSNILARWGTTFNSNVPPDGSVTAAKLAEGAVVIQSGTTQTLPASPASSTVEFPLPTWAKRVTLQLSGVSTTGTSALLVQLKTELGGWATSNYASVATHSSNNSSSFDGFILDTTTSVGASTSRRGVVTLQKSDTNAWVYTSSIFASGSTAGGVVSGAGSQTTTSGAPFTGVRLTTNSADTFDAGQVRITYE